MTTLRRIMLLVTTWMLIVLPAQAAVPAELPMAPPAAPATSQSLASSDDSIDFVRRIGGLYSYMDVVGTTAYLLGDGILMSVDITDPAQPVILGQMALDISGPFTVAGDYLYLTERSVDEYHRISWALRIVDIHDPANLTFVGRYPAVDDVPYWNTLDFKIQGQYVYLVTREPGQLGINRLRVIEIANPAESVETGMIDLTSGTDHIRMAVAGDFVYIAAVGTSEIKILSVADPDAPAVVGTYTLANAAHIQELYVASQRLYVQYTTTSGDYLYSIDVLGLSTPAQPTRLGSYSRSSSYKLQGVDGVKGYITSDGRVDQFQAIDFTNPAAPVVGALIDLGPSVWANWEMQGNYVYTVSYDNSRGGSYALKLSIVDFSNPGTPQIKSQLEVGSGARPSELTISGDSLYVINNFNIGASTEYRLQRYSLANPLQPTPVSTTPLAQPMLSMVVSGNYAYVSTHSKTMYVIDLNQPATPIAVDYPDPAAGTAYSLKFIGIDGPRVYALVNYNRFEVLDFSTPNAPKVLGSFAHNMHLWYLPVISNGVAWFIQQEGGDSICSMRGIDLSNPANMQEIARLDLPETPNCFYNLIVKAASDNTLYTVRSLYEIGSFTLQAIDISNPAQPVIQASVPIKNPIRSISIDDHYLYISVGYGTNVTVFDHSNPSRLFQVGSFKLEGDYFHNNFRSGVVARNGVLYQGNYGLFVLRARTLLASGTLRQANGLPFAGAATISASNGASRTSGPDGGFRFQDLPRGTVTFTPTLSGYAFWSPQQALDLPSSRWLEFQVTAQPLAATLPPAAITTLVITDTQGLPTTFQLDTSALSASSSVVITPTPRLHTMAGWAFSGHGFELKLEQALPVTTTMRYSAVDVHLASDVSELALWRWSGSAWEAAACAGPAVHTPATQTISVGLCQSGIYGLFAPTNQLFLPIVGTQ